MWSYRSAHFLEQHKMQHCSEWGVLVADRGPGCVPAATVATAAGIMISLWKQNRVSLAIKRMGDFMMILLRRKLKS